MLKKLKGIIKNTLKRVICTYLIIQITATSCWFTAYLISDSINEDSFLADAYNGDFFSLPLSKSKLLKILNSKIEEEEEEDLKKDALVYLDVFTSGLITIDWHAEFIDGKEKEKYYSNIPLFIKYCTLKIPL